MLAKNRIQISQISLHRELKRELKKNIINRILSLPYHIYTPLKIQAVLS